MLGPIGSNLMNILKILTPDTIEAYAQKDKSKAENIHEIDLKLSLDPALNDPYSNKKKKKKKVEEINPYANKPKQKTAQKVEAKEEVKEENKQHSKKQQISKAKVVSLQARQKSQKARSRPVANGNNALAAVGIESQDERDERLLEEQLEYESNLESETVFLLNQRDTLVNSNSKLKGSVAIDSYKHSSQKIQIKKIKIIDDDGDECIDNGSGGMLLNRKAI